MSTRHYATLENEHGEPWQIHYRQQGSGQDILLLHPSPLSSAFMQPLIELFSKQGRAIAWDTPGYGQSDSLPTSLQGLAPYVDALSEFISELGLNKPVIYGSATGAQIAIEFAKAYPEQTRGLLLENAAWFYEDELTQMLDRYFPDIGPKEDGSHLSLVWKMVNQLYHYFPWYDTSESALVNEVKPPLELRHKTMLDYLIAGKDYDLAYRAAFLNERADQLQQVQIPTRVMRWPSSLVRKYVDRLDSVDFPDNIVMKHIDAGLESRFAGLEQTMSELLCCEQTG